MSNKFLYIIIYVIAVFISSVAQILLKKGAQKEYTSIFREYCNVYILMGYSLFFLTTFITIYALRYLSLSIGAALETAGYFFVAVLSYFFLGESFTKKQLIGYILVLIGIVIFSV